MKYLLTSLITLLVLPVFSQLKNGNYRWLIQRTDGENIVFTTHIANKSGHQNMYIINGADSLLVDSIRIIHDSVFFELPFFESSFEAVSLPNGNLQGNWVKKSAGKVVRKLPFKALYNVHQRFDATKKPKVNIEGRWATTFTGENGKASLAVGEFWQKENRLTGTFRTPSGDYRFLEGIVTGDSVYLSGFDGGYAVLFKGKIEADDDSDTTTGTITGFMYSGNAAARIWKSVRNEMADTLLPQNSTKVKEGAGRLDFTFPDVDGKPVSINDSKYKNKVVVIQIMGSWCPNCLDEMKFVMENYERYKKMGVEFIALAYERTENFEESKKALQPFLTRFKIPYPVLIVPVSVSDEERTQKTLPQIEKISAFPTTIFVDKKGNIAKIHTGFDGPATGEYYEQYKQEFENTLKKLTQE